MLILFPSSALRLAQQEHKPELSREMNRFWRSLWERGYKKKWEHDLGIMCKCVSLSLHIHWFMHCTVQYIFAWLLQFTHALSGLYVYPRWLSSSSASAIHMSCVSSAMWQMPAKACREDSIPVSVLTGHGTMGLKASLGRICQWSVRTLGTTVNTVALSYPFRPSFFLFFFEGRPVVILAYLVL